MPNIDQSSKLINANQMNELFRLSRNAIAGSLRAIGMFLVLAAGFGSDAAAQNYPNPDFTNEIYAFRKDSAKLTRLEKETSKLENKTSFGGGSMQYEIDERQSNVRFVNMDPYSFVFYTGTGASAVTAGSAGDSTMRANGMDPNMFNGMGNVNPSQIALYKLDASHDKRLIVVARAGGIFNKKSSTTATLTTSVRKIRDGYFEIVPDKKLLTGEYAFAIQQTGVTSMGGGVVLFCFAVD